MDLPHSDAPFMKAYPAETTEAFLDGHVSAFAFFGGIPQSILYDNTKLAVAKICGDGKRERTRPFSGLVSHYLFRDRFGRPGKGNDKGKVEGLVKNGRRRFLTPVPVAVSFEASVSLFGTTFDRTLRGKDGSRFLSFSGASLGWATGAPAAWRLRRASQSPVSSATEHCAWAPTVCGPPRPVS